MKQQSRSFRSGRPAFILATVLLLIGVGHNVFAADIKPELTIGRQPDPLDVRFCGTVDTNPAYADEICGGISSNSNSGACALGQVCCNSNYKTGMPAVCGDGSVTCPSQDDICQMFSTIRTCPADSPCSHAPSGKYCCALGANGVTFSNNIVNLTIFSGDACKIPINLCVTGGAAPTPTATPVGPTATPTATATATMTATSTGSMTPTPSPSGSPTHTPTATPTATPGPGHTLTFDNECTEPVWIAARSNDGAFTINGNPPPWGENGADSWKVEGSNICCTDATGATCDHDENSGGCSSNANCSADFPVCVANTNNMKSMVVPLGWPSGIIVARTGCKMVGGALSCQTGDCNHNLNCGVDGAGADNATAVEFTMDAYAGMDNIDVSLVPAFNVMATISPVSNSCDTAGTCPTFPSCPWPSMVHLNGENSRYRRAVGDEIGVCLAPDKFPGNSDVPPELNPFPSL